MGKSFFRFCAAAAQPLVILLALGATSGALATQTTSRDAYARFDQLTKTWTLGTSLVEEKLQFTHGNFALISLENKLSRRQYLSAANPSEEFRVVVDGAAYTGINGEWTWKGGEASVLAQGEIQLIVTLQNDLLEVQKTYVAYPGTSIIRSWVAYQNRSSRTLQVSNPYFLALRLQAEQASKRTLYYMTGGGSFSGSQILKPVALTKEYARTFDTTDKIERVNLSGLNIGGALQYGSGAYMPWFCVNDVAAAEGLFAGLDYYGRWAAEIGNYFGGPGYLGFRVAGYEEALAPRKSLLTPKAFTGVYSGDLDSMGNQLKNWQYRYLWDYTNDDYFAKVRYVDQMRWQAGKGEVSWGGGTQDNWDYRMAAMLHGADVMRYVGADILWVDAGWHDFLGDNDGPDFSSANRYLAKSEMHLAVWLPVWYVEKPSRTFREHPDWFTKDGIDASRPDVIDWMTAQMDAKVAEWGDFQWRVDGSAVMPVNGNETPLLAEYHNIMSLERGFRTRHPGSSIDLCSGGGNLMGFEGLRASDVSQLTDGGVLYVENYYSSYLFPPDKVDDWTRNENFTWTDARSTLTMAGTWMSDRGIYGDQPGLLLNDGLENLRRNLEIYHYMVKQGVAGRWSQVYHPRVEGDDPVFYFERLSQDGKRGVILLRHFIEGGAKVYPKGLNPQETYDVQFEMSKKTVARTGAELMKSGITLVNPQPGELIYLGLADFPGSGKDHTPPSDPGNVRKRQATNMGVTGVEVEWLPATDNNWLSYYQIYRNGEVLGKVAVGTYYFDHGNGSESLLANYEVQAVDGDGNASHKIEANTVEGGPEIYTAQGSYLAGKDYSYQGAHGWSYAEWDDTKHDEMAWNGALGQMGLYEGALGAQKAVVGASWLRPGDAADAVRIFTLPRAGQITIAGSVHKDIYHTYGDGVRVKLLLGDKQVWPETGWQLIPANDIVGKSMEVKISVTNGDKLYFVANRNVDAVDDDLVWAPSITYDRGSLPEKPPVRTMVDDHSTMVKYSGQGWQTTGATPWRGDEGYLPDRYKGTLSISGTAGDKLALSFHGTGIEVIGDTGSDRGISTITLDGKPVATIDPFVPENTVWSTEAHPSSIREPVRLTIRPPIALWGTRNLTDGEHKLEMTVTGLKNKESTGTFIGIDAIEVFGGSAIDPEPK